jgi:D-beta-D-heptose 7-phosphate kinase / D-beta-D-heptose 1-phosphate adenosyltransferase
VEDLAALVDRLGCPRVLVVGDLILDRYTHGDAERISPEAPVPVLRADDPEVRPGGAASVAALLRALGAEVRLAGVVGDDVDGRVLKHLLDEIGTDICGVLCDVSRPTTSKERFLGRAAGRHVQQILRVDRESRDPLSSDLEQQLSAHAAACSGGCDSVVVSDYGKGVCTPRFLTGLVKVCREHGVPVLVDPTRIPDYSRYRGAEIVKPNRAETELAVGRPVRSPDDALAAGRELCDRWGFDAVLVTLDRDGLVLVGSDGPEEWLPAKVRAVYDITGAGDMVLAVMGLCRAAGLPSPLSARLANAAAGLEVERPGVAPINRAELRAAVATRQGSISKVVDTDELAALVSAHRRAGRIVVFTNGCFDLLHAGHLACLEQASRLGDVLVVAVNTDAGVRSLKGPDRPAVPEAERAALVAALECVQYVILFGEQTPHRLLRLLRPDVLVKGGTYSVGEVLGREVVEAYGGRVCVTARVEGRSTTHLLSQLSGRR